MAGEVTDIFSLKFPAKEKKETVLNGYFNPFLPEDDIDLMNLVLPSLSGLLPDEAAPTYGLEKSKYSDSWSAH